MAPLKSLCSERMSDWQSKLETKGISCLELTSDSPFYEIEDLSKHAVLIATPEKIDSLRRSLNGMQEFVSRISLLMVDEVRLLFTVIFVLKIHTIAEQPRGACLEGILTRLIVFNPRIIAVTATCSNISDVRSSILHYFYIIDSAMAVDK